MKVLVTGGAGFIGSHVVEAYLSQGHDVSVVDDLSTGFRHNLKQNLRLYQVDIRSRQLQDVLCQEKPDIVSHQAARANVRESFEEPLLYADVNVLGSVNLLECCKQSGVRKIIYASTGGAVYGEPQWLPVSEDHPVNPLDPYGASKHHVEHYLHLYNLNYGIRYTALRYPNVYGPRQNPQGEAGVVAIFTGQMMANGQPVINGSGEQLRDFVHVSDVARANVLSMDKGDNQIINIGSGTGSSVNTIFSLLAARTGFSKPPVRGPAKKGEVSQIFLNSDKAGELLGWKPEISLKDGLDSTVRFFESVSESKQVAQL